MRVPQTAGDFKVKAISGIHTVLLALDCAEPRRHGLLGFGVKRGSAEQPEKWLRSQKVFKSVEPNPKSDDPSKPKRFYTSDHPTGSSGWGDRTYRTASACWDRRISDWVRRT